MTAFLKIDRCRICKKDWPWEWVPPLHLGSRPLAGTGVWRSTFIDGRCTACTEAIEHAQLRGRHAGHLRALFTELVGEKPYREFTFEKYEVTPANRVAVYHADDFDPARDNLYIWGLCGVGKTHLAVAMLRRWFSRGMSILLVTQFQLVRQLRMRTPDEERLALRRFIEVGVLAIDDVGVDNWTAYTRQALQEILDGRFFGDRAGLIVTSPYSLDALSRQMNSRSLVSRLAGMCRVIKLVGNDRRRMSGPQEQCK